MQRRTRTPECAAVVRAVVHGTPTGRCEETGHMRWNLGKGGIHVPQDTSNSSLGGQRLQAGADRCKGSSLAPFEYAADVK
jgi:hypothetical protein